MNNKDINDLLTKIYNNIVIYEKDTITLNKAIDDEINQLIQSQRHNLSALEIDELKDLLSSTALTGQQSGFKSGVGFILKLIYSSLTY